MPTEPGAPAHGRYLAALRECGATRGGVRNPEYPDTMLVLAELGLVELRLKPGIRRRHAWYLTPAGRDLLAVLGT